MSKCTCGMQVAIYACAHLVLLGHVALGELLQRICHPEAVASDEHRGIHQPSPRSSGAHKCVVNMQVAIRICVHVVLLDHVASGELLQRSCYHEAELLDKWGGIYRSISSKCVVNMQVAICICVHIMLLDHVASGEVLQCICHPEAEVPDKWGGIHQ